MKNKPAKILDVPTIQKEVHDKHQMFIKKYGGAIDKVMADHQLFNDIVTAKLSRILVIFKQETAIDDFNIANNGPYTRITLTKKNYDTYIEIETNGSQIVLKGYTYTSDFSSDFEIIKK